MDKNDTMIAIDEAVADLVCARSSIRYVGKNSDHVQQERFDQFVLSIDGVVGELIKISGVVVGGMKKERGQEFRDEMARDDGKYWKEDGAI